MENEKILQVLNWRAAIKEFDSKKKIKKEDLELLEEALRLSPSSYGLQPWKFLVITNKELKEKLLPAAYNQRQVATAPVLVVLCAKTKINVKDVEEHIKQTAKTRSVSEESLEKSKQGMINFVKESSQEELKMWAHEQVFIALGVLLTTAAIKKIDAAPMGGFNKEEFDKILELKQEGYESAVICALGYRAKEDKYSKMAKVRFDKVRVIKEIK